MKINGYTANYNNLFVYNESEIVFETCRPNNIDIELSGIEIRSARKANLSKGDCFEIKSTKNNEYRCFTNGKDLYIPTSIFELVSVEEKMHMQHDGEKNYKNVYSFKIRCEAHKYTKHYEKVTDLPKDMPLKDYDPTGEFGGGFSKDHAMYDVSTNFKTKETYVCKKWLTYDSISELVIDSDYYTRTEKDEERLHREKIAEILTDCTYSNTHISHYEVARILEKLDISIKECVEV